MKITVIQSPTVTAGANKTVISGTQITLSVNGTSGAYSWSPSQGLSCVTCSSPVVTVLQKTTFYVIITNTNGCIAIDSVVISMDETCGNIYIPNAFSPNGDGQNDIFFVYGTAFNQFELKIYDQWGEMITKINDTSTGWDGTFKGKEMNSDVYLYKLNGLCKTTGEVVIKSGTIALVK